MPAKRAPFARWDPVQGKQGSSMQSTGGRKIVLHTTEGSSYPNWDAIGSVPHLTIDPRNDDAWQHVEFDRSAAALGSPGTPKSPNVNGGRVVIQVEIIGYAHKVPDESDRWYEGLAKRLLWLHDEWSVPLKFPRKFTGSQGYGESGEVRMGWDAFVGASGILGHSHCPYNDHWDPGNLDTERLQRFFDGEDVLEVTDKDLDAVANGVWRRSLGSDADGTARQAQWWLRQTHDSLREVR